MLEKNSYVTWSITGSLPDWSGSPFVVVVLLEESNPYQARLIAQDVLMGAMNP